MITRIAWRYFVGKKSTQAIQIISWVSVIAMAVGTAAIILVLSVFNGFESFIKNLYTNYYSDIKIVATHSKHFSLDSTILLKIKSLKGVEAYSKTLEEKVLLVFDENQCIVTLKGVDENFDNVTHFNKNIKYGQSRFDSIQKLPTLSLGVGVSNNLGANEETMMPIQCYSFVKEASIQFAPTAYNTEAMMISSVFQIQDDIDNEYAFTDIHTVKSLSGNENAFSSIEIKLKKEANQQEIISQINQLITPLQLKLITKYEQNKTLFFILNSERWAVFAILTFMLIIASFNLIGSLSMLVLDKEKDISILKTMGMNDAQIRKIFVMNGFFISLSGLAIGFAIALLIAWIQLKFGIVKLGDGGNFLVEAYPLKLKFLDFILVSITVFFIAIIASWRPAAQACHRPIELK